MGKVFTDREDTLLNKITDVGEQIIDNMCKDGVPSNLKEIRVLNEVMSNVASIVNTQASNRLKDKEIDSNVALGKTMVIEALQMASQTKSALVSSGQKPDFKTGLDKSKLVDGQTSQGVEQFNPEIIVNEGK